MAETIKPMKKTVSNIEEKFFNTFNIEPTVKTWHIGLRINGKIVVNTVQKIHVMLRQDVMSLSLYIHL